MHIAHNAYTAQREATSHFEASKKELPLKTKTTITHRTEAIKQMLSESGPESVLASKGRYSHTRTFAAGPDKRTILAFSPENKRVDGFVMNKDQQLIPVQPYDMPKELREILSSDAFEAFLKDVQARIVQLSNGDCRLIIQQGLKGGVYKAGDLYSSSGDIEKIKKTLKTISEDERPGGYRESRIIIHNQCDYPLKLKHMGEGSGWFYTKVKDAFQGDDQTIAPQAAGGIFYASTNNWMPFGTKGYISLNVETPGKHYVVVCAFGTGCWINNAAKIEIRPGNEADDSESTGRVADMSALFSAADRCVGDGTETKKFFERAGAFNVFCEFDNEKHAHFTFTFQGQKKS